MIGTLVSDLRNILAVGFNNLVSDPRIKRLLRATHWVVVSLLSLNFLLVAYRWCFEITGFYRISHTYGYPTMDISLVAGILTMVAVYFFRDNCPTTETPLADPITPGPIGAWVIRCFGEESFRSIPERTKRVLEEAIELAQTGGVPEAEAQRLVTYVYSRPDGDLQQEAAGLLLTIMALADSEGFVAEEILSREFERVLALPVDHFKQKREEKVAAGVAI